MGRGLRTGIRREDGRCGRRRASRVPVGIAALDAFFGTDNVPFSLDSRVTNTTRNYDSFHNAVKDVNLARTLAGFHFRNSCEEGSQLGRDVARYVHEHYFQPGP